MPKNKIFAFIGTTAAGKTYYSKHLVKEYGMRYIPSITTRPPRRGNLNEYKHVSKDEFNALAEAGKIFEYTVFNGHFYGKLHEDIQENLKLGHCVYTITADRVRELKAGYPETVVICITVEEPVLENTTKRLIARGHDRLEISSKLQTIESDIAEIEALKQENLIDCLVETIQGNKSITFTDMDDLVKKHA